MTKGGLTAWRAILRSCSVRSILTLLPVGAWIQLAAVCVLPIAVLLQVRAIMVLWQRRPLSIWTLLDLAPVWLLTVAAAWIVFAFAATTRHSWAFSATAGHGTYSIGVLPCCGASRRVAYATYLAAAREVARAFALGFSILLTIGIVANWRPTPRRPQAIP